MVNTNYNDFETWQSQIKELETFYANCVNTPTVIRLDRSTLITNVPRMIESHLAELRNNKAGHTFKHSLRRLQELKNILSA